MGRSILIIVWHLLNDPAARYRDLGADWHARHTDRSRKSRKRPAASSRPSATTSSSPSGRMPLDLAAPLTAYSRRQARGHDSPSGHPDVCRNSSHAGQLRWLFSWSDLSPSPKAGTGCDQHICVVGHGSRCRCPPWPGNSRTGTDGEGGSGYADRPGRGRRLAIPGVLLAGGPLRGGRGHGRRPAVPCRAPSPSPAVLRCRCSGCSGGGRRWRPGAGSGGRGGTGGR